MYTSVDLKRRQIAMNLINKTQFQIDPIAEARKNKNFSVHSKSARVSVRLATEVYEKRKQIGLSQIGLAEKIGTTQKVISNIESGDVNIGIDLLKRLVDGLGLSNVDLGNIFESCHMFSFQNNAANAELIYSPQCQPKKYFAVNNFNNYMYETSQH